MYVDTHIITLYYLHRLLIVSPDRVYNNLTSSVFKRLLKYITYTIIFFPSEVNTDIIL